MTLEEAINLARNLKYGPLPLPDAPTPTAAEALAIINDSLIGCPYTWLTGQAARDILQETITRNSHSEVCHH